MAVSYRNIIPPIFNFLTNLDRFSVWFLSPCCSNAPAYKVIICHIPWNNHIFTYVGIEKEVRRPIYPKLEPHHIIICQFSNLVYHSTPKTHAPSMQYSLFLDACWMNLCTYSHVCVAIGLYYLLPPLIERLSVLLVVALRCFLPFASQIQCLPFCFMTCNMLATVDDLPLPNFH